MTTVQLAKQAMGSRFELVLRGDDAVWLRAAGEEALAEIVRADAQLSSYKPTSEISRINARAHSQPVQVSPRLFELLKLCKRIHEETAGAFDVTVGPLMACWGFVHDTGRMPDPQVLAEAQEKTGMHLVHLDDERKTVALERPGMRIDLGGIGKGYGVDEAIYVLREAGVRHAFLHGGTSTIYGLGRPESEEAWRVAVTYPDANVDHPGDDDVVSVVGLDGESLSVSAVWGKSFVVDGVEYGHVIDPRQGRPVRGAVLSAVAFQSATLADAFSTAFLVMGDDSIPLIDRYRQEGMRAAVVFPTVSGESRQEIRKGI